MHRWSGGKILLKSASFAAAFEWKRKSELDPSVPGRRGARAMQDCNIRRCRLIGPCAIRPSHTFFYLIFQRFVFFSKRCQSILK
jgi:hypothetical protein